MTTYGKYRKNVYSQNGEDGVIAQICAELEITTGTFVEFGAWDGKYLSNTYHLLENGWNGIYIEGDAKKFLELKRNSEIYKDRIILINKFVEIEGNNCLDTILASTNIPFDFDLLSIDIDSYDWQIWHKFVNYRPKIVIIEINSNIPPGICQIHTNDVFNGSSFSSTVELGAKKGYVPVLHTGNLIFIDKELIKRIKITTEELRHPELLFDYSWIEQLKIVKIKPSLKSRIRYLLSRIQGIY
jgi:hypothetical protein